MLFVLAFVAAFMAAAPSTPAASAPPVASTPPAAPADARALIDQVTQSYRALQSYRFEGRTVVLMHANGTDRTIEVPFLLAAQRPARVHTEMNSPMLPVTTICDGNQTWTHFPQLGQYTRRASTPAAAARGDAGADTPDAIAVGTPLARYMSMAKGLKQSHVVREESVMLEGTPIHCTVVEADYEASENSQAKQSPTLFWIDTQRGMVLKEETSVTVQSSTTPAMEMKQTTTYRVMRLNEKLPDSLFTFHAPPNAKEVTELALPGTQPPDYSGHTASDFTLRDLAGKPHRLSSLKGKIVMLDFWATWCGPCRIELPTIAKIEKELRAQGLVVMGVNLGEPASTVSAFLKKNQYGFTVLLDSDSKVAANFGAGSIPTVVVIDRTGKISSHFVGVQDETTLRLALKKAGL